MLKKYLLFFCAAMLIFCGCSALHHDSPEELADTFIEAVIDGDEDAVWEAFAPETQTELLAMFNNDENTAKAETLKAMQDGLKRKSGQDDLEILLENEELGQQFINDLLSDKDKKFVEIDGNWFIRLPANDPE